MPDRAVFDASVLLRAALDREDSARAWTRRAERGELDAFAPTLVWAEVVNVLVSSVRGERLSIDQASRILVRLLELRIRTEPIEALAPAALARAVSLVLSGYDALYLVLAEALDATLVTADRRLADAAAVAELIP
jgi:predicted nucleic acid-binding protein